MRILRCPFFIHAVFAIWLAVAFHARGDTARVAVVGDSSLDNVIDLTTAELSKSPDLNVVERSDLAKLGQEQALQSAISSNELPPIQFVPADGLLILRAVKQADGKTGIFARSVAVQPGVVLREIALPSASDPVAQVKALIKEFAPYWPKLTAIQKGKIEAISLLGLRFEVDSPETRELERRINVLFASRLSAEPDTMVLERWRLNDAVFEKSLTAQQSAPFWTGSSLIDGSMKLADQQITVTMRVRPSQGPEISISDSDSVDHLSDLVGRLANKVQAHPMAAGTWQPGAEADHYAALGKWCMDNRLYDEGAEAIESALALGNPTRTTHMLQIRAYALLAYPEDFKNSDSGQELDSGYGHVSVNRDSLRGRLLSGEHAVDLCGQYLELYATSTDTQEALENPMELGGAVLLNCTRTLRLACDQGLVSDHASEVVDLRHALQKLIAQMEKFSVANPADKHKGYLKPEVQYASFWHESPEATLDYYHDLLGRKTDGALIRRDLFEPGYPVLHFPYLDADVDLPGAPPEYIGAPWLIAWDGRPSAEIRSLWQNFVNQLGSSTDPVAQGDALKFEFSSLQTRPKRDAVGAQFVAFLNQNHDLIAGPNGDVFIAGFYPAIQWAARNPDTTARNALRELIIAELKAHAVLPAEWITHFPFLFIFRDKADESQDFVPVFTKYCKWYQSQNSQDPAVEAALAEVQNVYVASVTGGTTDKPSAGYLPVHIHWPTQTSVGTPGESGWSEPPRAISQSLMTAENKVWLIAESESVSQSGKLLDLFSVMCVDPSTLQTVAACDLPEQYTQWMQGTPSGVSLDINPDWLTAAIKGHVLVWRRGGHVWQALEVPSANYKPRWLGQDLYLVYEYNPTLLGVKSNASAAATAVSGLIRVVLPSGDIENLISSRRTPPQNVLDGTNFGYALDLWNSAKGLMFALSPESPRFQIFAASSSTNDWKLVESDPMKCEIKKTSDGILLGKGFDGQGFEQLVLMKGDTSEILLSKPDHVPLADNSPPLWECPDDLRFNVSEGLSQLSPVMRGGDLCIYRNVNNGIGDGTHACLYYFGSRQKSAVKIPLEFGVAGPSRLQTVISGYQAVQSTDYGLVIGHVEGGFWVIPWSDIDAYRTKVAPGTISALPSAVSSVSAPVTQPVLREASAPIVVAMPATPPVPPIENVLVAPPVPATPIALVVPAAATAPKPTPAPLLSPTPSVPFDNRD